MQIGPWRFPQTLSKSQKKIRKSRGQKNGGISAGEVTGGNPLHFAVRVYFLLFECNTYGDFVDLKHAVAELIDHRLPSQVCDGVLFNFLTSAHSQVPH